MYTNSQAECLRTAARKLATLIDAAAGDYPILLLEEEPEPRLHWSYARVEIEIEVSSAYEGVQLDESTWTIRVGSIDMGFALVAATEAIRQDQSAPFIQYRTLPP